MPKDDSQDEKPHAGATSISEPDASAFGLRESERDAGALEFNVYFITWTTYGTWLPGDARGWRKRRRGPQLPQPLLEQWCRKQMKGDAVLLESQDRETVEDACRQHCHVRGWHLLAVSARTNHVHRGRCRKCCAEDGPRSTQGELYAPAAKRKRLH